MEIITNPDTFMWRNRNVGFALPIAVVLTAAALGSVSGYLVAPAAVEMARNSLDELGLSGEQIEGVLQFVYYSVIFSPFITTFAMWLIVSAVIYAISAIFGGRGSFGDLLKLMSFSFVPTILLSPVTIYLSYESSKYLAYGLEVYMQNYVAQALLNIALLIWQYLYWVYAVKNARGLSLGKSAIAAAIPMVAILVMALISLSSQLSAIL